MMSATWLPCVRQYSVTGVWSPVMTVGSVHPAHEHWVVGGGEHMPRTLATRRTLAAVAVAAVAVASSPACGSRQRPATGPLPSARASKCEDMACGPG
jgi:hypothetical protein